MSDRPMTQKEIKSAAKSKASEPKTTITNLTKRVIPIQVRDQDSDFYISERSIQIRPNKSFRERSSLFNRDQISNLRAKGEISVLNEDV